MSGKRVQVDLGQIAMPVGEHRGHGMVPGKGADGADVAKLQAILRRPVVQDRPAGAQSGVDLLAAAPDKGAQALPQQAVDLPAGVGQEQEHDVYKVGAELERLWMSNGAHGQREVRLRMRAHILPHTAVRLFEGQGRLQVEMSVSNEATRCWLVASLPGLGMSLGQRLLRPLRLSVLGRAPAVPSCDGFDWPEDR